MKFIIKKIKQNTKYVQTPLLVAITKATHKNSFGSVTSNAAQLTIGNVKGSLAPILRALLKHAN